MIPPHPVSHWLRLLLLSAFPLSAVAADAPSPAAQEGLSLLAPTDRGLRADLAWLVDRGVLNLPLGTWPMPSSMLRAAWSNVDAAALAPADADALARVQRAVLRSTDTLRLAARINSARHPSLDGGDASHGSVDGALSLYGGDERWGGQLTLGATADSLSQYDTNPNVDGSYLAVQLPGTVVSVGAIDRWWGPGQTMSPILSSAARPIPALIVRRSDDSAPETPWLHWIGQWGYEISAGRLAQYTPDGTRTIGLRFYTRPWPNVEFGVSRSILWAGEGRPSGPSAFWDALLGRSNVQGSSLNTDPSDEIAGFDLRASFGGPWDSTWASYFHLVGEDQANNLPSKYFGTIGLTGKAVEGTDRFETTLEATDTTTSRLFDLTSRPGTGPAYFHGPAYHQGYYQGGLPIGAAIGGGGILYTVGFGWTPIGNPDQLRVAAAVFGGNVSNPSPKANNASFPLAGRLSGFSLGCEGESASGIRWQVGVSMQRYSGSDRPTVGLVAGIDVPILTGR